MNSPWGFEWDSYDDEELDDEAECPDGDDDEPTTEAGLSPPVKPTTPLDALPRTGAWREFYGQNGSGWKTPRPPVAALCQCSPGT
jgi:hypothetical protein